MPPPSDVSSDNRGIFISYARADDEAFVKRLLISANNRAFILGSQFYVDDQARRDRLRSPFGRF